MQHSCNSHSFTNFITDREYPLGTGEDTPPRPPAVSSKSELGGTNSSKEVEVDAYRASRPIAPIDLDPCGNKGLILVLQHPREQLSLLISHLATLYSPMAAFAKRDCPRERSRTVCRESARCRGARRPVKTIERTEAAWLLFWTSSGEQGRYAVAAAAASRQPPSILLSKLHQMVRNKSSHSYS